MEEKYTRIYKVSIFEYIKRGFIVIALCSIAGSLGGVVGWSIVSILLILLLIGYANLYSLRLYMDEMGIYCYQGFLPWSKGNVGIGWQDCGGAGYKLGFFSYIFKSYTLTINHRFTNSSDMVVSNIHKGNEFVELVNEYLSKLHHNSSQDKPSKINR